MPLKLFLKKLELHQILLGILLGIICFFVWPNGTLFITEKFTLAPSNPIPGSLFIFGPVFFGIIAYSISKGAHSQRLIYLFVGSFTLLISLTIYFGQAPKDPVYDSSFTLGLAIMGAIIYSLGGLFAFLFEVAIDFLQKLNKSIKRDC